MKVVLDLDRTIWDTTDRFGNDIWAKQMVEPFDQNLNRVVDDVYSVCNLRSGVAQFLEAARAKGHELSFLSSGAIANKGFAHQPSAILLQTFRLLDFFNGFRALEYKTLNKREYLQQIGGKILFFDDNPDVLKSVRSLTAVNAIDSSCIHDWTDALDKYCG